MTPADLVRLDVTVHACQRFAERGGTSSRGRAEADLLDLARTSDEIELGALRGLARDLRLHAGEEARYFRSSDWVLACIENEGGRLALATVFPGDPVWRFARKKRRA